MSNPKIYALDFDGVICDSAVETGITGWKVANALWSDMPETVPGNTINAFRQVRPVMETGYEAILIVRLLFEGMLTQRLLDNFANSIAEIISREKLDVSDLKLKFGETRDNWINDNLSEWIKMNPLFEGIASILSQIDPQQCYIITTKQERFVSHILDANNLSLPAERIFGLDRKLSKQQILTDLLAVHPQQPILFIEDRLPTLINVINDNRLNNVKLFFADWGYNTEQDKKDALTLEAVTTIDLPAFVNL